MSPAPDPDTADTGTHKIQFRRGALGIRLGVLALLITLAAGGGFGYLLGWQIPRQEAALRQEVAQLRADQAANSVYGVLRNLRERVASAADSVPARASLERASLERASLERASLETGSDTGIAEIEAQLRNGFPEALSLHLLPIGDLGTAIIDDDDPRLRNHIEVDLVRRASEGEQPAPEAFRFEDRWLVSLAQLVSHPRDSARRGVILVTLPGERFAAALEGLENRGQTALLQRYTGANGKPASQTLATQGTADTAAEAATREVPDTRWQVAFTPGSELLQALQLPRLPLYLATGLALLVALAGVLLGAGLYRGQLRRDSRALVDRAARYGQLSLGLRELLGPASALREALQGNTAMPSGAAADHPEKAATAPPAPAEEVPAGLLYQKNSMFDEEQESREAPAAGSQAEDPAGAGPDVPETLDLDLELGEAVAGDGFPAHIFRAYDIRGHADSELGDDLARRIGLAIGGLAGERDSRQIIVASDGRLSSPRIRRQLINGLLDSGLDVIDIGVVPTPLLHFATHHLDADSGVMVTGSHNPGEDNGFKMVLGRRTLAASDIQSLRERVQAASAGDTEKPRGRVIQEDIIPAYLNEIAGDIALAVPLRVVIDAGNGATSEVAPQLMAAIGCEVIPLFCDMDGSFPNHPPDTSDESNLKDLVEAVRREQADLGVAFDGDGDRVAVVTASGAIVRSDRLLMVLAQDVVSRNPGADVVFDVKCTRHLTRLISEHGGRPVMWKTGHAFMRQKIAETGALLGGEFSGHIFFGERWYGFDDGMYAAARLTEILSTQGQSMDEALANFPLTANTPEILVPVPEAEKFALMSRIEEQAGFSDARISKLDGIRVDFRHGWGLLRASNTTAALTARFEADSDEELARIMGLFRDEIARLAPDLEPTF